MQPPAPWAAYAKGHAMRLLYYLAAAILLVMLIPILQASAFTMDSTSGTNSDGSSRFVDPDEQVRSFRRNARGASAGRGRIAPIRAQNAWGHHASCSCAIGLPTAGGVLTSDLRVHGTTGVRVVDASVFPRIPGIFIVCPVYMVGEKAADSILESAKQ